MSLLRRYLAAVIVLSFVLPVIAVAGEKEDSEEAPSKELKLKACGPDEKEVNYKADTDKNNHPTPPQPADKALIYVLRPTMAGSKIQTKLAVDGDWKGTNRGNNYFYFTLAPGEHYFCSVAENHSLMTLKVEAGKTYFVQQHVRMGFMKARNKIEAMTNEEGNAKVSSLNLATWEVK